jgi:hypothetical protein
MAGCHAGVDLVGERGAVGVRTDDVMVTGAGSVGENVAYRTTVVGTCLDRHVSGRRGDPDDGTS